MEPAATTTYDTRQFKAGNSYAVRLSSGAAYPPDTMLTVTRIGQRTIIEPREETLEAFGNWLLSLPRSVKIERMEMDYDPEEKWHDQN
ncbi:MAG: hypothetical protein IJM64_01315 [Ottowia sp.]|nr:hypothetical protein [Ottowia sp.]